MITYHYSTLGTTRSLKTLDGEDNTTKGGVLGGENPYSHPSYCVPGPVVSTSHVPCRSGFIRTLCKGEVPGLSQFLGMKLTQRV